MEFHLFCPDSSEKFAFGGYSSDRSCVRQCICLVVSVWLQSFACCLVEKMRRRNYLSDLAWPHFYDRFGKDSTQRQSVEPIRKWKSISAWRKPQQQAREQGQWISHIHKSNNSFITIDMRYGYHQHDRVPTTAFQWLRRLIVVLPVLPSWFPHILV